MLIGTHIFYMLLKFIICALHFSEILIILVFFIVYSVLLARLGAYCTSGSDGCHQTVQLDVPVPYVLTGVPQLLLHLLE